MMRNTRSLSNSLMHICLLIAMGAEFLVLHDVALANTDTNPVIVENQKAGSDLWQLWHGNYVVADEVNKQVVGYTDKFSVNIAESIQFKISANPPQAVTIDLFRMGWYGGKGGRLIGRIGPLFVSTQPECPLNSTTGLIECDWKSTYTLSVPSDWTSGVYLAVLTNKELFQSHITFVVRDDTRVADMIYQQPMFTYAAYNNYPADGQTGKSLYSNNSFGPNTISGEARAVKVSLDRPDTISDFSGASGVAGNYVWEIVLVRWLERNGYDVVYSTDLDTHEHGEKLLNYKVVIVAGHDEYWTTEMMDAFERAKEQGVSIVNTGANNAYWHIRLEPSSSNQRNRVIVCYRNIDLDPAHDLREKTIRFRGLGRPEQQLFGVQYSAIVRSGAINDYVVKNSASWVYSNTGLIDNDTISGLIGPETDQISTGYSLPISNSFTILGESLHQDAPNSADVQDIINKYEGGPEIAHTIIYQAPSGAWVFSTGSLGFVWALDRQGYRDFGIQKMLRNILDRMIFDSNIIQHAKAFAPPGKVEKQPTATPRSSESHRTVKGSQSQDLNHSEALQSEAVKQSFSTNQIPDSKLTLADIVAGVFACIAFAIVVNQVWQYYKRNQDS